METLQEKYRGNTRRKNWHPNQSFEMFPGSKESVQ